MIQYHKVNLGAGYQYLLRSFLLHDWYPQTFQNGYRYLYKSKIINDWNTCNSVRNKITMQTVLISDTKAPAMVGSVRSWGSLRYISNDRNLLYTPVYINKLKNINIMNYSIIQVWKFNYWFFDQSIFLFKDELGKVLKLNLILEK